MAPMTGTDMALLGGGSTEALTFVLGVVQRYVSPRIEALRDRVAKIEERQADLDHQIDERKQRRSASSKSSRALRSLKCM